MNRRKFIINTGIGALGLYFAPYLVSCENKHKMNLNDIIGQSISLLSSTKYLSKEGNENFGYYHFDEKNFTIKNFKGKEAFVFYKNSEIIGYTLKIDGIDFFKEKSRSFLKSIGNYKINFKNDFGEEFQWHKNGQNIKLSYNDYQNIPKLSFLSEFLDKYDLIV